MKRSLTRPLALAISVLLASIAFGATSASALSIAAPTIIGVSGDYVFNQTGSDRVTRKNLRTGKLSSFELPFDEYVNDGDADSRLNSRAIATVTGWSDPDLTLSIAGIGIKPRILDTLDRSDTCGFGADMRPLQIDTKNVVTALIRPTKATGTGCSWDLEATRVTRYTSPGRATNLPLSLAIREKLVSASGVAVRGDRLVIAQSLQSSSYITVFDLITGVTIWEGTRPPSTQWSLPATGVIWSRQDYLGHNSRAYRFNYETGKSVAIRIPHPRAGESCGKFTVHAGGPWLEVYNASGHLARKMVLRGGTKFRGTVYCSGRMAYVLTQSTKREGRIVLDLTKLR